MRKLASLVSLMCLSTSLVLAETSVLSSFEEDESLIDQEVAAINVESDTDSTVLGKCRYPRCSFGGRRGPRGPTGPTGAMGPIGIPGGIGLTGPTGASGPDGGVTIFDPQVASESGYGLGVDQGGDPLLYFMNIGDLVAQEIINQGGASRLVTNALVGTMTFSNAGTVVVQEPGYYLVTYGVSAYTGTVNTILSVRSTLTGDIPGSQYTPAPTGSLQTLQTIYFSTGLGEGLRATVNDAPAGAASLFVGSPAPNEDVVFFIDAVKISD